jgi:hypothetical protein
MTTLPPDIRLLLDLYVDSEIDPADMARVEKMLQQHAAARQYVANLKLVGELFRMDLAQAQSRADLDGVFERVCARLGYLAPRDAELELLAMAAHDGEALDPADQARLQKYLALQPAARSAVEGLPVFSAIARAAAESDVARVDFGRLQRALDSELDAVDRARGNERAAARATSATPQATGVWVSIAAFARRFQAPLSSLATAAVIFGVAIPLMNNNDSESRDKGNDRPSVVNNYYIDSGTAAAQLPVVQSVQFEDGYWAAVRPGDTDAGLAPVVWISTAEAVEGSGDVRDFDEQVDPATLRPLPGTLPSGQSL